MVDATLNPPSNASRTGLAQRWAWLYRPNRRVKQWLGALLLLAILLATRVPFAPRYLITYDAINFAWAIEHFDPSLHQPQPPGYPLFVLLLWTVSRVIPDVEAAFLTTALLMSWTALLLLWRVGNRLLGLGHGWHAALLLVCNPVFWLAALTNPVRLSYAAGALAVTAALLEVRQSRHQVRWWYAAVFLLSVAEGFRPTIGALLLPVTLWTAWRAGIPWRHLAGAALCGAAVIACWFVGTASFVGGVGRWLAILRQYASAQTESTSLLSGAAWAPALRMALQAICWTGLGALSWVWVSVLWRRKRQAMPTHTAGFLLVWFLPGLLFFALFHVGDPDHTLLIVPVTCLWGAAALGRFPRHWIAVPVALNVILFFVPISRLTKPATYPDVRWMDNHVQTIMGAALRQQAQGPATWVFYEPVTGWRQMSYYLRDVPVTVIQAGATEAQPNHWQMRGKQWDRLDGAVGPIAVPTCGTTVFVDMQKTLQVVTGQAKVTREGRLTTVLAPAGTELRFHGLALQLQPGACADARRE